MSKLICTQQDDRQLAFSKREKFRIQIRRRAIDEYQRNVRNKLFCNNQTQNNEQTKVKQPDSTDKKTKQQYSQNQKQFKTYPSTICMEIQNCYQDVTSKNMKKQQINANIRLEQIGLIEIQAICSIQTLAQLQRLSKLCKYEKIKFNLDRLLFTISINEQYWSNQFISQLLKLMEGFLTRGMQVQEHVLRLTECVLIQKKVMLYKQLVLSNILNNKNMSNQKRHANAETSYQFVIKVIQNIVSQAPVVRHFDPNLYTNPNQINPHYYIEYLFGLMVTGMKKMKILVENVPYCSRKINLSSISKDYFNVLTLAHNLLSRLNGSETLPVIQCLKHRNWDFILLALYVYNSFHQSQMIGQLSATIEIKIKLKIMQISLIILQFNYNTTMHSTKLQYLYIFLPNLIRIINDDLIYFRDNLREIRQYNQLKKNNKKNRQNESALQKNYEKIIIRIVYAMMIVEDELQRSPAADFIFQGHPQLLQCIYEICSNRQKHQNNQRPLACLTIKIISLLPNSHVPIWICDFIQEYIFTHEQCHGDKFIFAQLLKTISNFLKKNAFLTKSRQQPFLLVQRLTQNKVYALFQKLALQPDRIGGELASNIETLLQILQQIIKQEQLSINSQSE